MHSFKNYHHFLWVVGGMLFVSYIWIAYHMLSGESDEVIVCLFRRFTGLPCPGCRLTRAIIAIFTGKILSAIQLNPLVLIIAPALIAAPIALIAVPQKCYTLFQEAEDWSTTKTGIISLVIFFATLWAYLIINNL